MTKTHTMRVDEEYWRRCHEIAEATAESGERPNVSAVARRVMRLGLEVMDQLDPNDPVIRGRHPLHAGASPRVEETDPSS